MKVFLALILIVIIGFFWIRPQMYFSKGKTKIIMSGRSTMELWFKHWNWPYPLRLKTTYRKWPISYKKYSSKNLFMEYHQLSGPITKDKNRKFGQDMLQDLVTAMNQNSYDVIFFKFCFVDFRVKKENIDQRFENLTQTVKKAYSEARKRKMKIILGNSLPLLKPNDATIHLQKKFNAWISDFADKDENVLCFDLYTDFIDNSGALKPTYARGIDDTHLNDKAFTELDKKFFEVVPTWVKGRSVL